MQCIVRHGRGLPPPAGKRISSRYRSSAAAGQNSAMAHHGRQHLYVGDGLVINLPPPDPNMIVNMPFHGSFATFGCAASCGCTPHVAKIPRQYAVPLDAAPFITLEELNDVANKANSIVEQNFIPPMPLMLTHICIPFSPVCVMSYYFSALDARLNELMEHLNTTVYQQRGCHWVRDPLSSMAVHATGINTTLGFFPGLQLIRHGAPQQPGAAVMAVSTVESEDGDKALGVGISTAPNTGYSMVPVAISPTGYTPVATAVAPVEGGVEMTVHAAPAAVDSAALSD